MAGDETQVGCSQRPRGALGIAHGGLSEKTIYFAAGDGPHEQIEILGFGLAGLSAGVSDQPTPQDDLRALGQLGYRCLTAVGAADVLRACDELKARAA